MATQLSNKPGKKPGRLLRFMDDYEDDEISFEKYKNAHRGVVLEIHTKRRAVTGFREVKCEYGHQHLEPVKEKLEMAHLYFDEADIRKLRDFLNDHKWLGGSPG